MIKNRMRLWNTNAPGGNKVQIDYFKYIGHGQGDKVCDLGVIWKGFISWVCMIWRIAYGSNIMAKVKVFATNTQTGQKLDSPSDYRYK